MRLAVVRHRSVPGGAEKALAALCTRLPDAGVEPVVVLCEEGPLVRWLAAGGVATVLADPDGVSGAVAAAEPEAVLSMGAVGHTLAAPAAADLGVPALWWQELTPRGRVEEERAQQMPTAMILCCTAAATLRQRRTTPTIPTAVLSPGIEVEAISGRIGERSRLRASIGWEGCRVVGMVARLDPIKGQDRLLAAAPEILSGRPDARILLAGGAVLGSEGDLEDQLRLLVDELGGCARLVGHVDDPIPWHAALDVSVNASAHEAFGLSVLESLALGRPVVATDTDGSRELLDGGACGLLTSTDGSRLAFDVGTLLDDPVLAGQLGAAGAVRARSFSATRAASELARLLEAMASRNGPAY